MEFNSIDVIKEFGFTGFHPIRSLWKDPSPIPKIRGVYMVLNHARSAEFLCPGVGGLFKRKDPNVSIEELKANHVENALVTYIGKAGGTTSKATLHSRIRQYLRFGQGKNVGHWGGRLIWQIKHHEELVFCWKSTPDKDPREIEKGLLHAFNEQFNRLPFANLAR